MFERNPQGEEFAHRIPAQIAFFLELLDVLRCRAARPGLEQPTTIHQRNDGEHLRAGAQLKNREEVGEVVTQHVASHGNRVFPGADAFDGEADRRFR